MIVTLIRLANISADGSVGNEPTPPFGLAYLAGACKEPGIDIKGIDAQGKNLYKIFKLPTHNLRGNGIDIDEVIQLIDPKTEIIGISVMFSHEWVYIKDCIKLIKENFPKAIIVTGGEHVTALPEFCLRDCKAIDYISLGEGEETWSEIIKKRGNNFDEIAGLAYLKNNKFVQTEIRKRIKNI